MNTRKPIPPLSKEYAERFGAKHTIGDGCWLWKAYTLGYPRVRIGKRMLKASRVSYRIAYARDPGAKLVCHTCDNPRCVRPEHLFLGTTQDNTKDRVSKGRSRGGANARERNPNAKLSPRDVEEIRASKIGSVALSKLYGVGYEHIWKIRTGGAWKNKVNP